MSSKFDRRKFLTHSAATVGGVALAGSVVDGLLETAAGAATGVNTGKPKMGGTLTVGTISDVPNYHIFNGAQGKMDASGFCVANALYDPLFVMSKNGKAALPMLALSATPNSNYTVWTVALRQGVAFTNGDPFNADTVVANYNAAAADPTVGLAIQPIIQSVTKVDEYTVDYNLVLPFSTYPVSLAEQQITYMAHPSSFVSTYTGNPIGTGPFMVKNWQVGVESQLVKNPNYWRSDSAGRQLPYLAGINFKTIVDPTARNQALQSGSIDMMVQQDGSSISALSKMKGISYRTDLTDPRDPSVNCLIINTTGTMNQFFAWAGEFTAAIGLPGCLSYIKKGQAPPAAVQMADYEGTLGAVDPSTLTWNTKLKPVVNDPTIRKAMAMAINRETYWQVVDGGVGTESDGIFKKTSQYYKNPGYPAYNVSAAQALVNAYKSKNNVTSVGFVLDIISGSSAAQKQFAFFNQALSAIGITVTPRPLVQSTLINNVIYGTYDVATWNQFGGTDPSLNYVWFVSTPAAPNYPAGLSMSALPSTVNIAGAVNFAHLGDPVIENAMKAALAAPPTSSARVSSWQTVNSQFAVDIPYLFLDTTVTAWAARLNVQNWVSGTAGDGTTPCFSPDGGSARWDQIWKS